MATKRLFSATIDPEPFGSAPAKRANVSQEVLVVLPAKINPVDALVVEPAPVVIDPATVNVVPDVDSTLVADADSIVAEIVAHVNEHWQTILTKGTLLDLGATDSPLSAFVHARIGALIRRMFDLIKTVRAKDVNLKFDDPKIMQYLKAVTGPKPSRPRRKHLQAMGMSKWGSINAITKNHPEIRLAAMHALLSIVLEPLEAVFEDAKAHHEEKAAEYEDKGNYVFADAAEEMQATLDQRIDEYSNAASIVSAYGAVGSLDDLDVEINEIKDALGIE